MGEKKIISTRDTAGLALEIQSAPKGLTVSEIAKWNEEQTKKRQSLIPQVDMKNVRTIELRKRSGKRRKKSTKTDKDS